MVISGYLDHQSTQFRLSASELFVSVVLVLINALLNVLVIGHCGRRNIKVPSVKNPQLTNVSP